MKSLLPATCFAALSTGCTRASLLGFPPGPIGIGRTRTRRHSSAALTYAFWSGTTVQRCRIHPTPMQLKESHPNGEQALNGNQGVVLRILAHEGQNSAAGEHTEITLTNIADAVKQGVKEAIANEERLLDYRELAKRIGLGV